MIITAGKRSFQELNNEIRGMLLSEDMIRVEDVNGQRYIGAALDKGKTIEIHGTPGNDMGAYLNGGNIVAYGNGQEAVGNTMGGGLVTIHAYFREVPSRSRYSASVKTGWPSKKSRVRAQTSS